MTDYKTFIAAEPGEKKHVTFNHIAKRNTFFDWHTNKTEEEEEEKTKKTSEHRLYTDHLYEERGFKPPPRTRASLPRTRASFCSQCSIM